MVNQVFEIHFHHGGQLIVRSNEAGYVGGLVDKTNCDMDKISLPELIGCVKEFGGYNVNFEDGTINMRLWYRIPGERFMDGKRMVLNDGDIYQLAKLACGPGGGHIDVYVDHGVDVPEVLNVQQVVDDEGPTQESMSLRREPVEKGDALDKREEMMIEEKKRKALIRRKEIEKNKKKQAEDKKKGICDGQVLTAVGDSFYMQDKHSSIGTTSTTHTTEIPINDAATNIQLAGLHSFNWRGKTCVTTESLQSLRRSPRKNYNV